MNSFKSLIAAHQTEAKTGVPKKTNYLSNFSHLDISKYFVQINGKRYPRDAIDIDYTKNDYFNQYRDLKAFSREYVGEPILNPFIIFIVMKTFCPIQVIDLRFQIDHVSSKIIKHLRNTEQHPVMLDYLLYL